jgi:hypothetical protein
VLFNQCSPPFRDVDRFDGAQFPSQANVGVGSNQMELANRGFHHGQFHAVEGLVLKLGKEGVER